MNNNIVVIDSSDGDDRDDEEPVLKKAKLEHDVKHEESPLPILQIGEIKSLVEKEIVLIEDEEETQKDIVLQEHETENTKDPLEITEPIVINTDLNVENNLKSDTPNEPVNTEVIPTEEVAKTEEITPKRVELTPVIEETVEINENFVEKPVEEDLLEYAASANTEIQENGVSSTSEEKPNELIDEFELFLTTCKNCECEDKYKELILQKLPKLEEKYAQASGKFIKSDSFKKILKDNTTKIKRKPSDIILFFCEVYRELSGQKKRTIQLSEKDLRNLERLHKALKKINKRIGQLELAECDMDEERNSEYMILDRYKKRATLIHKKICSITNENPYATRQLHKNLDISCSKYSEINRAIDKFYSRNKQFPSFYDVDRCVRKCVKQNNILITDSMLNYEIDNMFKHVGELLKRRRKLETYETINDLVEPADEKEDPELEKLMDERHIENEKRIDEVLQKYVAYQEQGQEPTVSSDSDDSNHESEDSSDE